MGLLSKALKQYRLVECRLHASRYIFGIYDFDESGVLSVDETILALRSTVSGLCKLCGLDPPLESEIEAIALMVSVTLLTLKLGPVQCVTVRCPICGAVSLTVIQKHSWYTE